MKMNKRRKRCESCKVLTDYREAHHIIPVSLGGSDEKSNIIRNLGSFPIGKHTPTHVKQKTGIHS